MSGDTIAVGAPFEDSASLGVGGDQSDNNAEDSGAVYVFTRSGATWAHQAYVKASNTDASDDFGRRIALDGNLLAVTAHREDSAAVGVGGDAADDSLAEAGAAYLFSRQGGEWTQRAYVKASNSELGKSFGSNIGVSQSALVVSSSFIESTGAAYVFE